MKQIHFNSEKPLDFLKNIKYLEDEVNEELDHVGQQNGWIWKLFLLALLPNILNGFHISSYLFLGKKSNRFWCEIPVLSNSSWTHEQMLLISSKTNSIESCGFINYNYSTLSSMNYENALNYSRSHPMPPTVSCLSHSNSHMEYMQEGTTIVSEWNLVCENSIWRTIVQVIISFGKCIGGSIVGVMSDKYGRKYIFTLGCVLFTSGSLLATFSPYYWSFLIARLILGLAAPSMFYSSMIMMTENVGASHRAWTGMAFNYSYSLGMLYLATAASFLNDWRDLQLALTLPAVFLLVVLYYFKESPRWLLSKRRTEEAYEIVFQKPIDKFSPEHNQTLLSHVDNQSQTQSKGIFYEIKSLYGTSKSRRTAIVCHFGLFTVSFSYIVTAINAGNLSSDPVVYVSVTGLVDALALSSSIVLLIYVGRKWSCFIYYALAAMCMFVLLVVPKDEKIVLVSIAMVGRLGVTAAFAIVVLYTAELFPTEVRSSAVGISSMFGHVGAMMAPLVVDFLGQIAWFIPTTICGVALFLAAFMILLNPETSKIKLVDHVDKSTQSI